jgi:hypothetical protein
MNPGGFPDIGERSEAEEKVSHQRHGIDDGFQATKEWLLDSLFKVQIQHFSQKGTFHLN